MTQIAAVSVLGFHRMAFLDAGTRAAVEGPGTVGWRVGNAAAVWTLQSVGSISVELPPSAIPL
jgi:hypothetical protein